MSKLLTSTLITTIILSANSNNVAKKEELLNYVKHNVVKNPQVEVKGVTVIETTTHNDLPGWNVVLATMDLNYQGKDIHVPETMFIKDGFITGHLVNLKTGKDYRDEIKPSMPESMYDDAHLLFGNKDAKHKILVFSDPMCPFCQEIVPDIIKAAKEHPEKIALYYYHLPLIRIHPVSAFLTRIMHIAQEQGKNDVVEKMYSLKIDPRTTDMKKILPAVQKHTGFEVTEAQVNDKKVISALKNDENSAAKMMVSGTPTVYIDGKWDKNREGYKKLIK